jgi:hypothetical protein
MNRVRDSLAGLADEIERLSVDVGHRVRVDIDAVLSPGDTEARKTPGAVSADGACRLIQAKDDWIAVNLPGPLDHRTVPAWIGCAPDAEPWAAIRKAARGRPWRELAYTAFEAGLAVAGVGEITAQTPHPFLHRMAPGAARRSGGPLKVVDFSSQWAGPFAGAVLARAGAQVTKIESRTARDAVRGASPATFERLNGEKEDLTLDFGDPADRAKLAAAVAEADVIITSAGPGAAAGMGLTPQAAFSRRPSLVWIAVTGYGWMGENADRLAYGDDAAAAGGLVRWDEGGAPNFIGHALADPLTGFAAAAAGLEAMRQGGGFLVDAPLARTAADVAGRAA